MGYHEKARELKRKDRNIAQTYLDTSVFLSNLLML